MGHPPLGSLAGAGAGSALGAVAVAGVAGFTLGSALNSLLGALGLNAHLTFYGDWLYDLLNPKEEPPPC